MRFYLLFICLCGSFLSGSHGQSTCSQGQAEVIIELQTDRYGYETSWELTGQSGTLYGSVAAYGYKSQRLYRDTLCIPVDSCTTFTIRDKFGDGIAFPGYYLLLLDGDTLVQGGDFYDQASTHLLCAGGAICSVAVPVTMGAYSAALDDTWYQFTPDIAGIYRISTRHLNTCDTKIWVYPTCDGITIAEDNQSTIFFNDNASPQIPQAEIKSYFYAGKTYLIRIGDKNQACFDSIHWTLTFEGQLKGCTDPNACNYSPLATIDDGSCLQYGNRRCPKEPDLLIRQDTLLNSLHLDTIYSDDPCLVNEGCLRGYGLRQVLKFSTQIENIGERDYVIGIPSQANPNFTWNNCHNHFHYDSYAEYLLIDEFGKKMPVGFKNGLCITDFGCKPGYNPKFSCDYMGISANCYDIYWSDIKCQWIDITDLPDGRYTLAVRINWQNQPDALGQVEKNLNNNVAQVCIRLDRSSGNLKVIIESTCDAYRDCAGTLFGDAQPDCLGICNGNHLSGDVNENGLQDFIDVEQYVTALLGNDMELSACTDLNADGTITVQDAVLLANCLNYGTAHPHPGAGMHSHCAFPVGNLLNKTDTVTLGMLDVDWEKKYVDIGILNPSTNVSAYQFQLTGGLISHVENLVDERTYPITVRSDMSNGRIIGLSYRDSVIYKSALMQPLCRVHFLKFTQDSIVLKKIVDIINSKHERVICAIGKDYLVKRKAFNVYIPPPPTQVRINPNPFQEDTFFSFYDAHSQSVQLQIINVNGTIVRQYFDILPPGIYIQRAALPAGIYFYKLIGEKSQATGKFVIK